MRGMGLSNTMRRRVDGQDYMRDDGVVRREEGYRAESPN